MRSLLRGLRRRGSLDAPERSLPAPGARRRWCAAWEAPGLTGPSPHSPLVLCRLRADALAPAPPEQPARAQLLASRSLPLYSASSAGSSAAGAAPPAGVPVGTLIEAVFSDDTEVAAAAVERLCAAARDDAVLVAALGSRQGLTLRLRDALAAGSSAGGAAVAPPGGSAARERLQMYSAYLLSMLAGRAAAIDASLLDQRVLPALLAAAAAATAAGSWGVARGALRAVAKLLDAQPDCAAAQLLACGGVGGVAGLLGAADSGECAGDSFAQCNC